jgi:CRISPR/Cas system-associated protein Csm6
MVQRGKARRIKKPKSGSRKGPAPEAGPKLVMVLVYMTPEERALLDEICYYIGKNSQGRFRPSRSELIRRFLRRFREAKRSLKQVRTEAELDKVIKRGR